MSTGKMPACAKCGKELPKIDGMAIIVQVEGENQVYCNHCGYQHLKGCEAALAEKDARIAELVRALDGVAAAEHYEAAQRIALDALEPKQPPRAT